MFIIVKVTGSAISKINEWAPIDLRQTDWPRIRRRFWTVVANRSTNYVTRLTHQFV